MNRMRTLVLALAALVTAGCDSLFGPDELDLQPLDVTLSAGSAHVCAITTGGVPLCWGAGSSGQLGTGSQSSSNEPAALAIPLTVRSISAGEDHSCAITEARTLYCWGDNNSGELGDGTEMFRLEPVQTQSLAEVTAVATGLSATCALANGGVPYCWGSNPDVSPIFGVGFTEVLVPTALEISGSFVRVMTGHKMVCAIRKNGAALCQGDNDQGELGVGGTIFRTTFRRVVDVPPLTMISRGLDHLDPRSLALSAGGRVFGWGGTLAVGPGGAFIPGNPEHLFPTFRFRTISVGIDHNCAIDFDDRAFCWGANYAGQLGDGTVTSSPTPTPVYGALRFAAITAGGAFTCGLSTDGKAWCWGSNVSGQLGDGTTQSRVVPTPVYTSLTFRVPR